jgi:hypothetical protein
MTAAMSWLVHIPLNSKGITAIRGSVATDVSLLPSIGFRRFWHSATGCEIQTSQKFGESEVGAVFG